MTEAQLLANFIESNRSTLATQVTDLFLERHPDWVQRFGDAARLSGEEDAGFHLDFLAGAILTGSEEAFGDYARWAAGVLAARGIAPSFLEENLNQLGQVMEGLLTPAQQKVVVGHVNRGRRACALTLDEARNVVAEGVSETLSVYLEAALRGDRRAAWTVVEEAMAAGRSVPWVYESLLREAQHEVGRRWADNLITVAHEHTVTAVTQYVLARLYDLLPRPPVTRGAAVVTGVAGELHGVGAQMVADAMEMDGWSVRFLGTGMPHAAIVDAVSEAEAAVLAVSVTLVANIPKARELIASVRAAAEPLRILVGGSAFPQGSEAWRAIGADACGLTMADAVALAGEASTAAGLSH